MKFNLRQFKNLLHLRVLVTVKPAQIASVFQMAAVSSTRKNTANRNIFEPEVKSTFFHESKTRKKNLQCLERSA